MLSAGEGVRVISDDVAGTEDALDRTSLDIELFVAKAFMPRSTTDVR